MATHSGITTEEFEFIVKDWLFSAVHSRFNRPFTDLVYQPMLELLDYLRTNDLFTFNLCPDIKIIDRSDIKIRS